MSDAAPPPWVPRLCEMSGCGGWASRKHGDGRFCFAHRLSTQRPKLEAKPSRWDGVARANAVKGRALTDEALGFIARGDYGNAARCAREAAEKLERAAAFDYVDRFERGQHGGRS